MVYNVILMETIILSVIVSYWASVVVFYNGMFMKVVSFYKKGGGDKNFNLVQYYSTLK